VKGTVTKIVGSTFLQLNEAAYYFHNVDAA
jgi:hypothetical protein